MTLSQLQELIYHLGQEICLFLTDIGVEKMEHVITAIKSVKICMYCSTRASVLNCVTCVKLLICIISPTLICLQQYVALSLYGD